MEVTLRPAKPTDAPALASVVVAAWHQAYRDLVPDSHLKKITVEYRTERFRESLANNAEETYLADFEGTIAGFVTLGACRDLDVNTQVTGEIWGIYLAPDYWRKGIGRCVTEWAENTLASRGFTHVVLWVFAGNNQARSFYEAMGFVVDGASKILDFGRELELVRYCKEL